jgi:hypothetical protein
VVPVRPIPAEQCTTHFSCGGDDISILTKYSNMYLN